MNTCVPLLTLSDVTKSFGTNRVLDGIDLELRPGTILGLVGPNAAGKTTLISLLTGLVPPDSGSIRVNEVEVDFDRHPERRRVFGLMLNGRLLVPELRPTEYFEFLASMYGLDRLAARRRVQEMATTLALTPHLDKPIKQLSAGTQKKVEFIAALFHEPRILVFDEPFEAIDPPAVADLTQLTRDYVARTNAAAIISTHVLPYVRPLATEIRLLWGGRLHEPEALGALLSNTHDDGSLARWQSVLGEAS
jgi:ABC-2 type transport system ATP-binding protein